MTFNSDMSSTSEVIKPVLNLCVGKLCLDLETKSSMLSEVDLFVTPINNTKEARMNKLNAVRERTQDRPKMNEMTFEYPLKYTKMTYNVLVSLNQCK